MIGFVEMQKGKRMRLIDADKIVYSWQIDADGQEHDGITLESIINKIPTIEPEILACGSGELDAQLERERGEWIKEYWNGEHTRKCFVCNITQTVTTYRGKVNFNYCPYCGARMLRGEEDDKRRF